MMCFGLPACTQTRRSSLYFSDMITTKTSVLSLQTMRSCNKGMLSEIVYIMYMLAEHCTPTINRQCYIPVNSIVAEKQRTLPAPLPHKNFITINTLGGCLKMQNPNNMVRRFVKISQHHMYLQNVTIQSVHIENCKTCWDTAHNLLQHLTWVNVDTCPFCTFVCPQLVWNKNKELFFAGPNAIFPGLDNRQTCFTLDTMRRCLQTASIQSKEPDQHLMSQSHCNSEHWYSCRQRMIYVGWSTWIIWHTVFQRFSSLWSPRSYLYVLFRSWLPTIKNALPAYQPSLQRVLCMPQRLSAYFRDCCWQW
jgi:hypothetical protein